MKPVAGPLVRAALSPQANADRGCRQRELAAGTGDARHLRKVFVQVCRFVERVLADLPAHDNRQAPGKSVAWWRRQLWAHVAARYRIPGLGPITAEDVQALWASYLRERGEGR